MHLHRTYGHSHAKITCLDWSSDSMWILWGSEDLTVGILSFDPIEGYRVQMLVGHKDSLIGVFFTEQPLKKNSSNSSDNVQILSISKDATFLQWTYKCDSSINK